MMKDGTLGVLMNGVHTIRVKDAHITNIWETERRYQFNLNKLWQQNTIVIDTKEKLNFMAITV